MLESFSPNGAVFNSDRTRRYLLWRTWELNFHPPKTIGFIMLNPSIASESILDPTVRRCLNFAKRWGYGRMLVGNLNAKVSTDPKGVDFKEYEQTNMDHLLMIHSLSEKTILAWGANADYKLACDVVGILQGLSSGKPVYHLGITKGGFPKHPLYLKSDVTPTKWTTGG